MLIALMAVAPSFCSNQPTNSLEGDGFDNSERPLVSNSHFTTPPRGPVRAFAQSSDHASDEDARSVTSWADGLAGAGYRRSRARTKGNRPQAQSSGARAPVEELPPAPYWTSSLSYCKNVLPREVLSTV